MLLKTHFTQHPARINSTTQDRRFITKVFFATYESPIFGQSGSANKIFARLHHFEGGDARNPHAANNILMKQKIALVMVCLTG
jgi:hypothetical protein